MNIPHYWLHGNLLEYFANTSANCQIVYMTILCEVSGSTMWQIIWLTLVDYVLVN